MKKDENFIMLPTVDFCFKELMQNPKVRRGFIAALMKIPPEEVKETMLLPTIMERESEDSKMGILDVRVLMDDGTQFDMEMQVSYFEYWDNRVLFYLSKIYADQLRKGDSYEKLKKCVHVSILDFVRFPDDDKCYRTIHLRDDETKELYSDLFEIQVLELAKLSRDVDNGEDIICWMRFFSGQSREEFEYMAKTNEYLDEAYNTLVEISADEKKRLEYEAREKALKDYNTQISSALKRGEKIGEKIGEKRGEERGEERSIRVLKLYMQKKKPEEIAEICGVTVQKVLDIIEKLCTDEGV